MKIRLFVLAAVLLTITGCAHPAPRAISLPSAAPVRAAIAVAKSSNARAQKLANKAVTIGIVAGSADAKALVLATTTTGSDLADALAKADQLTAQILVKQAEVDHQTAKLAALTIKYDAAVKTIWWYRVRFWGPIALALAAVGVILVARFTAWGARTLGPYLVDAEHVAVKAAVLA